MRVATVDFMKAFDSITYNYFGMPSKHVGTDQEYISFLKRLFKDQKATVLTDKDGDMFEIKKGTKQGDPPTSLLFNTVVQVALEKETRNGHLLRRWRSRLPHEFALC